MNHTRRTSILSVLAGTGLFLAVAGCTADADPPLEGDQGAVSLPPDDHDAESDPGDHHDDDHDDHDHDHAPEAHDTDDARPTTESAGPAPRLGVTYDGGVLVLDAYTLEVEADLPAAGFLRLNPAGDGRHFLLTDSQGFRALDAGTWSEPHGNHDHSYTTDPLLTDLVFPADHPGHVVTHGDTTVLFADGTGEIQTFASDDLAPTALPETEQLSAAQAHHGVAVRLEDGSTLLTLGTEEERSGALVQDADGEEIARSEECPGVHGETVAAGEVIALGCEDGVLLYRDGEFVKVQAEADFARSGNLAGHEESPYVLGDYKTDPDAELERPTQVVLIDTAEGTSQVVDLPASYSFRSLARGPEGAALVLGTDGILRSLNPATGEVTAQIEVVAAWEEPVDWQQPRPTLHTRGQFAYVTDPASQELHVVDLAEQAVIDTATLPVVPNELSSVTG
ncbi:zinc metallochaperone AztD [Ornithinimicrobium faecis]|uniref:Zinc metallochaperone AztD n=1 Tax=Ornithinimicrobium faecis TaxID=2934158 RepID=A0ABY4YZ03_9MICO|nr:zinc metallochaperone AztD [Ornithinimicrobium sp. HY1793]USQ81970.1 zinc metallochaperone AztD [Ornithinimicrobium sp. HY1793]